MSFVLLRNSKGTLTSFSNIKHELSETVSIFKSKRIRNAKNLTFCEYKSFVFQFISFFSNCLCLLASIIYAEIPESLKEDQNENNFEHLYPINDYMIYTSIMAAFFYGLAAFLQIKMELLNRGEAVSFQNGKIYLFEAFSASLCQLITPNSILAIHPTVEGAAYNASPIFRILSLISYLRIILIYSFLVKMTRYFGSRIGRLLNIYGCKNQATNIKYAIKCNFKQHGLITNFFLLLFGTVFLGIISQNFQDQGAIYNIQIGIYSAIVTTTTIGYGELLPEEAKEKGVAIIIILVGGFCSSVCTLFFLGSLQLTDKEQKAYRSILIKRLHIQQEVIKIKCQAIANFIKDKKEGDNNLRKSLSESIQFSKNKEFITMQQQIQQKLKFKDAVCKRSNAWRDKQTSLIVDKQPLYELVNSQYIHFCGKLKSLVENQLLSDNLLTFYFQRNLKNASQIARRVDQNHGRKRVEDSTNLFSIKLKIIG